MKEELRVIISGGGTGGHIFPAIAIANAIREKRPEADILFVGAKGRMEMQRVPDAGYKITGLSVAGFDRKHLWKNFSVLLKLVGCQWKARQIIKEFRPHVAVGVGGYASGPILKAAQMAGIPTLIQEQNSYAGVTNKLLAKKAQKICVAYEGMEKFFPAEKIILTGNPVRQGLLEKLTDRKEALRTFGLDSEKKTMLIVGGSLGALSINQCLMNHLDVIQSSDDVQFIWQTGKIYHERVMKAIEATGKITNLHVTDFIKDMASAYVAADLIISRAGAGSISEFCLLQKAVILVPSPNVAEDHQTQNTKALTNKHAAVYVKDSEANDKLLSTALDTIHDDDKLRILRTNIAALALPDSASIIAEEVFKLSNDSRNYSLTPRPLQRRGSSMRRLFPCGMLSTDKLSTPLSFGEGMGVRPRGDGSKAVEDGEISSIRSVYFIGAGGIGMSALVRYFLSKGKTVAGYDRTPCELTERLINEGALIHYEDNVALIPTACLDKADTLVVWTPAVPHDHSELVYFQENGFEILKRAQVLGIITRSSKALCVAGTHGKTTTSTMLAHLLYQSEVGCTAFLGGISKNYESNLLLSDKSPYTVIEADEFDRSFHQLSPYMSIITATDPDHLDVYGTEEAYMESFEHYTELIRPEGCLVIRKDIKLQPKVKAGVRVYTYSKEEGDFHAENIRIGNGEIFFDFIGPDIRINNIQLGVPVSINIENGVGAAALARLNGANAEEIKRGMASFRGVDRRFDFKIKNDRIVFLSDYAHHPSEIRQSILSIRELYKDRQITIAFQPHLYTRTRDFYDEFADSLSLADEVILLDIYPAREPAIPGVTSQLIYDQLRPGIKKTMCRKEEITEVLKSRHIEVLATLGAGDIEDYVPAITQMLDS